MRRLLLAIVLGAGFMWGALTPVFAEGGSSTSGSTGTVAVQTIPGQSLADIIISKAKTSWPWYVVRAAGIVAGVSAIVLMLSGIGSVTGHTFRFLEPLTAWATHRAIGITFAISTVIHMVTLLFDKFVPFTWAGILIPWVSNYKPLTVFGINLGSVFVALGVLAFYVTIAIVISSLLWIDKRQKLWKFLHISVWPNGTATDCPTNSAD